MKIYKFRNCYLNTLERRVVRNGVFLDMTPRTFDVLMMLVERPGEIVTKDEILGTVWNGSFVEEGNLPVHISKLRRLLDESRTERFIETAQGSGYRFVSPVHETSKDEWLSLFAGNGHRPGPETPRHLTLDSIAVLPFINESNNSEIDYLADGLTESLINSLSQISQLRVIARNTVFRYKDKDADPQAVGQTLGVSAVLTGRIRAIKENLIIGVELVRASDGTQLWGDKFDKPLSEILGFQTEIISAVSNTLIPKESYVANGSENLFISEDQESYRLYLKGKHFQVKRTGTELYKAIECFQKSVSYDQKNIYSYVEIVECYFLLYTFDYISRAHVLAAIKPLLAVIPPNQPIDLVQTMYGGIKMYLDWEFAEAQRYLQHALEINPNCLLARYRYSESLMISGRLAEALEELHKILAIDPFSLLTYKRIGRMFWKAGQFENAIIYLRDALELAPRDYEALLLLGTVLTEVSDYDQGLSVLQDSLAAQENVETLAMVGYAYARAGRKSEARKIIKQIQLSSNGAVHSINLARIYVALGEKEIAYDLLEEAYDEHEIDLVGLPYDSRLGPISGESRFRTLMSKVGVPPFNEITQT